LSWPTAASVILLSVIFPDPCLAEEANHQENVREITIESLRKAGWKKPIIASWLEVNQKRLDITQEMAPELVSEELRLLKDLAPPLIQQFIKEFPEAAGLLIISNDPASLVETIRRNSGEIQPWLINSFLLTVDGQSIAQWTEAVARHGPQVAFLQQYYPALPWRPLFALETQMLNPKAKELYGKWLDEILAVEILKRSADVVTSRVMFALSSSEEVINRLESNQGGFRDKFIHGPEGNQGIWPRLREAAIKIQRDQPDGTDILQYCYLDPLLLDFFHRPDSKELFEIAGYDAAEILCGENKVNAALEPLIVSMWKAGHLDLPRHIVQFHNNGHFLGLLDSLKKRENWGLLNDACRRLQEKGDGWSKEASYLAKFNEKVLRQELHSKEPSIIPGAAMFSLCQKWHDGRRIGAADLAFAALDAVDIVLIPVGIATGGSSVAMTAPLKAAGKKAVGEIAENMAESVIKKHGRKALQQTLRTGSRESAEKLAKESIGVLGKQNPRGPIFEAFSKLPAEIQKATAKGLQIDITGPVKSGFAISKKMQVGGDPFRKVLHLEPRLFMRPDGRVFINLLNVAAAPRSPVTLCLARNTTEFAAIEALPMEQIAEAAYSWEEQVSAWWVGHATGQFKTPKE